MVSLPIDPSNQYGLLCLTAPFQGFGPISSPVLVSALIGDTRNWSRAFSVQQICFYQWALPLTQVLQTFWQWYSKFLRKIKEYVKTDKLIFSIFIPNSFLCGPSTRSIPAQVNPKILLITELLFEYLPHRPSSSPVLKNAPSGSDILMWLGEKSFPQKTS